MRSWTKWLILVLGVMALQATSALPVAARNADDPSTDLQTRVDEFVGLENGGVAAVTIRDGSPPRRLPASPTSRATP